MAFSISPGIVTSEVDLTSIVPAVSTTTGAIAGVFTWGPVLDPILISTEVELASRFGRPLSSLNPETFFAAADFLAYGNSLYVTRINSGNTAGPVGGSVAAQAGFSAKYVGAVGNSIRLFTAIGSNYASANNILKNAVTSAPAANTAHVVVYDETGAFSGTAGTVIEIFEDVGLVSTAKKPDGTNNWIEDVVNSRSSYIKLTNTNTTVLSTLVAEIFIGGTDGADEGAVSLALLQAGYDTFNNPDTIDVSLLLQGVARGTGPSYADLGNYLIGIAESRKDLVVFLTPPRSLIVNVASPASGLVTWSNATTPSSYAVLDSGYKYRYDKYNDRYIYTPLNGDIAGLCARTDDVRDPWFSPAGYNRGSIKNIVKLAYNPSKTDRDTLYKVAVNAVITQPGQGTVMFGDKTHLLKASAFDRINVRRLFIVLEKSIAKAAKSTLFEFNDDFTRAQFRNIVEPFLREIQGRRGIYDFRVVCDETNNTPLVIDQNQFVGDIYVKPARAINFITLNFVAVRTGVEFEEIVGRS